MKHEPVAAVALIEAVILLVVAFGWSVTTEQLAAIMTAVVAAGAIFARSKVAPVD